MTAICAYGTAGVCAFEMFEATSRIGVKRLLQIATLYVAAGCYDGVGLKLAPPTVSQCVTAGLGVRSTLLATRTLLARATRYPSPGACLARRPRAGYTLCRNSDQSGGHWE